jgi:hypothetical protein
MGSSSVLRLAVIFALIQVGASTDQYGAESQPLTKDFYVRSRATFRVWGSHSEFAPSFDGRYVYFGENGPDGLALKRADLSDGRIATLVKISREIDRIAPIPGDPRRIVAAWRVGLGGAPPHGVSLINLEEDRELELDTGEPGGDGVLQVSPSGRFLATGTAVVQPVRGPWHPSEIAVYSLPAGKREFTFRIPSQTDADEENARTPADPRVVWTTKDVLVIGDGEENVFRRSSDGTWLRAKVSGRFVTPTGPVQEIVYRGEHLRFRRSEDEKEAPEALFTQSGKFFGYHLPEGAVALRETVGVDGWREVEAVVLKWRKTR